MSLALLGMRIDDDDWHVDAGRVKVEMLFRPRPTTAKVQVLIFEFRGGRQYPLQSHTCPLADSMLISFCPVPNLNSYE